MQNSKLNLGRGLLRCLLLVVGCYPALLAQSNTTALSGSVMDQSGALISGVEISVSNSDNGSHLLTTTKSRGEFSFDQIPPGKYEIHVVKSGFSEVVQTVELLVATPLKLNFKLVVGTAEVVNVESGGMATINSDDGTLGKAFNSSQIQTLPYLANNITYLLSLQPGVLALDAGAQTGGQNQDPRTGIVNGARQDQSNITLDGVDNNDQNNGFAFNGVLRATRESVEEFRVTTTNGNADAGRSSGAQVSLVTRSGTNSFHGSAYEYYRDPGTSANNWFLKQSQLTSQMPNIPAKILQHTYGGSFGAPLVKNKLFFFGAYEGFAQASDQVVTQMVPSVATPAPGVPTINGIGGLITGNVSYLNSSSAVTTLSQAQIAKMDKSGIGTSAATLAYFKQFPLSNTNSGGDGYNTGGYTFASPAPLHQITNIARIDYTISSRQDIFIRGNLQSDNQASTLQFPGLPANSNIYGNSKGIAIGYVWNISSALINNFRYGFVRSGAATRGVGSAPYTSISGITPLTGTTTSSIYTEPINNFIDDLTFVKGHHTFQFGVNDRFISNSRYADAAFQSNQSIAATLLATAAIAGKGGSFDPAAFGYAPVSTSFYTNYNNAILANTGIIEAAQSGTALAVQGNSLVPLAAGVVPTHTYRNWEQEYYFQDQWRATPRLSITAGIRYVYLGTPYEKNGQELAPTLGMNTFLESRTDAAAVGASYNTRFSFSPAGSANGQPNFWAPQKKNFAPRISIAYSTADNRTSIRGGFAIAYDHFGDSVIDYYDAGTGGLFSLNRTNKFTYTAVDTNPRFTGYGNLALGPVSNDPLPLPYTPADAPFTFDRGISSIMKTPYAETFNLSVQREIVRGMTLTASYVGRLGRHVLSNLDVAQPTNLVDPGSGQTYFQAVTAYDKMIDAGVPVSNIPNSGYFQNLFPNQKYTYKGTSYTGAQAYYASLIADRASGNETDTLFNFDVPAPNGAATGATYRFFFPQTSSIFTQSTMASSNYNALQLSVRHMLRNGLEYDVNYTYGKSMDYGSSPERASANLITNTFNPAGNYAVSDFDVRHNITANYNLPLPFGRGKAFLRQTNGFIDRLVGGWQLNGVVHYSTGFPFSPVATGNYGTNFDTSSFMVQTGPIASGGHRYVAAGAEGNSAPLESAFKNQSAAQVRANLRFAYPGETGQRNIFRGDGYLAMDDGLSKSFRIFGERQFKISVEVFNVLNDVRFSGFSAAGSGSTATSSAVSSFQNGTSSNTFGHYTVLLVQPRQMQFSGKYTF